MTYQKKPKKQTTPLSGVKGTLSVPTYHGLLNIFEKKRKKDWVINKASQKANFKKMVGPDKVQNVKMIQRFTGKRGK